MIHIVSALQFQMHIERAVHFPFAGEAMLHTQPLKVEDLVRSLQKCRKERNLDHALRLHACIRESGLEAHPSLGNLLVSLLMEVGSMCHAQQVFDRLVCRDVCSWNALITGYLKYGEAQRAVTFYDKMRQNNTLQPSGYSFVAILKACAMLKDLERGHAVHVEIATNGLLHTNIFVGSTLIDMYSKCGSLSKAQEVFDKLPIKNIVCWNALLTGYVEHGHADKALDCLKQMHSCRIEPNAVTFLGGLKACGSAGMIDDASELHVDIVRQGLETDLVVGSSLIDMYGKRAYLAHSQNVFDKLPIRNVVSWTALIAGYSEHGFAEMALAYFEQMKTDGVSPGIATFLCSLKACSNLGFIKEIHAEIVKHGLEGDPMAGSTLIEMYARCGSLATAHEVFEKLVVKDVVSWTAIMAGDADHGYCEEAFSCYEQMQQDGISPSVITISFGLHACAYMGASKKGQEIHADITRRGLLEWDLFIGSTLVEMYTRCGLLAEAQKVFDQLPFRSVAAWNAIITAYAEHGHGVEALNCLQHMQHEGVSPDANSFVSSLKACSSIGATEKGREIYVEITKKGLETDPAIGSNLISMLAKCDNVLELERVFVKLPINNEAVWTAIITGYVEHGQGDKAMRFFYQMANEGVDAGAATFICIMKACSQVGDVVKVHETYSNIIRKGLDRELPIGNALVDMYARSGFFVEAHKVLSKLPAQTTISWTALITGYNEHGYSEEAFRCFQQMKHERVDLDIVTISCSLEICGRMKAPCKGLELHAEFVKRGIVGKDTFIGRTLVDMYAKLGLLEEAQQEFGKLQVRNTVTWMSLINGYSDHGHGEKARFCFEQMQIDGFSPCAAAIVCILKACGNFKAIDMGREMHSLIVKKGLEEDLVTGSSLIDMYIKCGSLTMAQEVFNRIPAQDVVLWNALMSGYAQLGECESVFYTFDQLVEGGGKPDDVTFLIVLNACNHAGLADEGQLYFDSLSSSCGCIPTLEHYNCIADLLGRAGLVDEAMVIIEKMPLHPGITMWHAVLGSCQKWGNVELGKYAFEHVISLRQEDAASYVCMSNIIVNAAV